LLSRKNAIAASTLGLAVGAATPDADAALAQGVPLTVIHMLTGIINPAGEMEWNIPRREWAMNVRLER
jgi:hypothetical protein